MMPDDEYSRAVRALSEIEADPEGERARVEGLGGNWDRTYSRIRSIVDSRALPTGALESPEGMIGKPRRVAGSPRPSAETILSQAADETRLLSESGASRAEAVPATEVPSAHFETPEETLERSREIARIKADELDPTAQTFSKRRELSRPPEFSPAASATPSSEFGLMGPAPSFASVPGQARSAVGVRHPIIWREPTLEEFRADMGPQLLGGAEKYDQNSSEYKVYADMAYARAYDDAVERGVPIQRAAFNPVAQEYPMLSGVANAVRSAAYAVEDALAFGIPSKMEGAAYPEDRVSKARVRAEHPVAGVLALIGASLSPVAPANLVGGAVARRVAPAAAEALGGAEVFGVKLSGEAAGKAVGGAAAGAAAGATQALGEGASSMATGERPVDAQSLAEETAGSAAIGGGVGLGIGALQRGARSSMDRMRADPNGPGPDLARAERYTGAQTTMLGGIDTPDKVRALRTQAQLEGKPSVQHVVAGNVEDDLLDQAWQMSDARRAGLDRAASSAVSKANEMSSEWDKNLGLAEQSVTLGAGMKKTRAKRTVHAEQEAFWNTPQGRGRVSMKPVVDAMRKHLVERIDRETGQSIGDTTLLQAWIPKFADALYVPEGTDARMIKRLAARKGVDAAGGDFVSRAEARAMGFNEPRLQGEASAYIDGWRPLNAQASDRVLVMPRKLNAREHSSVTGDMTKAFLEKNLGNRPEFSDVLATSEDLHKAWGPKYAAMMEYHSGLLREANDALTRVGMPTTSEGDSPSVHTRTAVRGVLSGYGAPGRDSLIDKTIDEVSPTARSFLRRNRQIVDDLDELGLLRGETPASRSSWTPGQRATIRTLLENYGVTNPPKTDAALREFLGRMERDVVAAQRAGGRLESVGLPRTMPERPSEKDLAPFRKQVVGYDPSDPAYAELGRLAEEAGVSEQMNVMGGLNAHQKLQSGPGGWRFYGRYASTSPGGAMLYVPRNMKLRADAAKRHVTNIPPGAPGVVAGSRERKPFQKTLSADDKLRIMRILHPQQQR